MASSRRPSAATTDADTAELTNRFVEADNARGRAVAAVQPPADPTA
jgi:hypothetical protein